MLLYMFSWIRSTNSFQKNNKVDNLHSDWVTLLLRDNFDGTLPLQVTHSSERIIQLLNNSQLRRDIFLTLGESLLILAFHHQWEVFSADALLKLARDIFFPCAFGLFSRVQESSPTCLKRLTSFSYTQESANVFIGCLGCRYISRKCCIN